MDQFHRCLDLYCLFCVFATLLLPSYQSRAIFDAEYLVNGYIKNTAIVTMEGE